MSLVALQSSVAASSEETNVFLPAIINKWIQNFSKDRTPLQEPLVENVFYLWAFTNPCFTLFQSTLHRFHAFFHRIVFCMFFLRSCTEFTRNSPSSYSLLSFQMFSPLSNFFKTSTFFFQDRLIFRFGQHLDLSQFYVFCGANRSRKVGPLGVLCSPPNFGLLRHV